MKKNKEVIKSEIRVKSEKDNIQRGVSKGNVILIGFACLLVGFILGATVAILKTTKVNKIAGPSEESQRVASVDREGEIKLLKAALEKDPKDLSALIELGDAYFDTDRHQEAIDAYSKALAIDPKNADARTDLGIIYRKLKQFDKAIEAFRQAAQDHPMHVNSRFNLGIVLKYDKNDPQGAIQAWEEFLKLETLLDPGDERPIMVKKEIESMKASLSKK
jgi:cytochrome c-type biogenesis protein CcmH/NrfG